MGADDWHNDVSDIPVSSHYRINRDKMNTKEDGKP